VAVALFAGAAASERLGPLAGGAGRLQPIARRRRSASRGTRIAMVLPGGGTVAAPAVPPPTAGAMPWPGVVRRAV
jgi:hypothetical protein